MNKKAFITDCDGLLLDFGSPACAAYEEYFGDPITFPELNKRFYENPAFLQDFRKSFCHSPEYAKLPAIWGMTYLLNRVSQNGYDIHVVSAALNDEISLEARTRNLANRFGNSIKTVICLDSADKLECISQIAKHYDFVAYADDSPKTVREVIEVVNLPIWFKNDAFDFQKEHLEHKAIKIATNADDIWSLL